jgi:hypothetical protein
MFFSGRGMGAGVETGGTIAREEENVPIKGILPIAVAKSKFIVGARRAVPKV